MEQDSPTFWRRAGRNVFTACVGLLLGPSLVAWPVRGTGADAQGAAGAALCAGFRLGGAYRETLWLPGAVGPSAPLFLGVALAAAIGGIFMRRPLLGESAMVVLPLAALMLPMAA